MFRLSSIEFVFHLGCLPRRSSSIEVVFHLGRFSVVSSSCEVVFHFKPTLQRLGRHIKLRFQFSVLSRVGGQVKSKLKLWMSLAKSFLRKQCAGFTCF